MNHEQQEPLTIITWIMLNTVRKYQPMLIMKTEYSSIYQVLLAITAIIVHRHEHHQHKPDTTLTGVRYIWAGVGHVNARYHLQTLLMLCGWWVGVVGWGCNDVHLRLQHEVGSWKTEWHCAVWITNSLKEKHAQMSISHKPMNDDVGFRMHVKTRKRAKTWEIHTKDKKWQRFCKLLNKETIAQPKKNGKTNWHSH